MKKLILKLLFKDRKEVVDLLYNHDEVVMIVNSLYLNGHELINNKKPFRDEIKSMLCTKLANELL